MIVNGYKITPLPDEVFPFRASVHDVKLPDAKFVFLDLKDAEAFYNYVDQVGEAARAYRKWLKSQEAAS